jgi:alkanesulfonate monooxygenase SsuD/methylene tetrahydromethanopterin reductase-like flavin-dependent oxidoreductase (luciferase family)
MRFGLLCSAQAGSDDLAPETGQGFREYLDLNVEAEALGFHSSFLVEHHFTGWNQVAEAAATLDVVSGGRLVITRSWLTRSRFSHRGRFWHFEDIVVEPPPAQTPHPPFWVAAGSDASIRRAARRGFNLVLDQYASAEQIDERISLYRTERAAHGLPFDPMQVAVARQLYVATDRADGTGSPGRVHAAHVLAYAEEAGGTEEHALYGIPDEICARLAALNDAGAEYVLLTILGGSGQLRRVSSEIMPALTRRSAGS